MTPTDETRILDAKDLFGDKEALAFHQLWFLKWRATPARQRGTAEAPENADQFVLPESWLLTRGTPGRASRVSTLH